MTKWNVIADGWRNGKYCLGMHVNTREEAEIHARRYKEQYEGKPFPNGQGWYACKNFRAVQVPVEDENYQFYRFNP